MAVIFHEMDQGSEEWHEIRKGVATASHFKDVVTDSKLELAAGHATYARKLACERLGIESEDFGGTSWMQRGIEYEEFAIDEFEQKMGVDVRRVGFAMPDDGRLVGCSPDGLVGEDETIQVKCPMAENVLKYIDSGEVPREYRMQCQGELWVTGRQRYHFWAWHPQIENTFHRVVERDEKVMDALDEHMTTFLELVELRVGRIQVRNIPDGLQFVGASNGVEF